jgi:predicted aspartyl protease
MIETMHDVGRGVLVGLVLVAGTVAPAQAQFYRWTDEQGDAHYTEGLGSVPERYRSKAVPLGLRNAPAPPAGTPDRTPAETLIRFTPGRHILVNARLNGSTAVRLILDTGAGTTLISPRVLAAAGVSLTQGTASGRTRGLAKDAEVEVTRVVVDSLEVGEARVERLAVSAYDMGMPDMDGLLGQDFLARFNVSIDPAQGIVKLAPK